MYVTLRTASWWRRRATLQRLFTTFPGGAPGLGLFLLRVAVGGALVTQGSVYFGSSRASLDIWILAAVAIVCAIFLVVGLFTPIVSLLAALGVGTIALSLFPSPIGSLFSENMITLSVILTSLATVLLGPGAFSLDARFFGRRQIIIPQASKSTEP